MNDGNNGICRRILDTKINEPFINTRIKSRRRNQLAIDRCIVEFMKPLSMITLFKKRNRTIGQKRLHQRR